MSNCKMCREQQHFKTYRIPNKDYFVIQTVIQTICPKRKQRTKSKSNSKSKSKIPKLFVKEDEKQQNIQNKNLIQQRREVGRLKATIGNYEGEIKALKQINQKLKQQIRRSYSQTRTPTYPTQQQTTSIGKIVKDKLVSLKSGKISLGSDKRTAEDMDDLLIDSSKVSYSSNSQQSSYNSSQHFNPTHRFAQLMLKLQKPHNESEQRMIRDQALRVAGKIRKSKHPKQQLIEGLYYS